MEATASAAAATAAAVSLTTASAAAVAVRRLGRFPQFGRHRRPQHSRHRRPLHGRYCRPQRELFRQVTLIFSTNLGFTRFFCITVFVTPTVKSLSFSSF